MKIKRNLLPVFPMPACWTLTVVALAGCYNSYSADINESANDGGDGSIDSFETFGGDDTSDTPKTDDGKGTSDTDGRNDDAGTPDTHGGEGGAGTPDTYGGEGGAGTPDTFSGEGGAGTPDTFSGKGGIDTPDTDGGYSFIDKPMEAKTEAVQLTESEWTDGDFADRYDNRWFTIDVVNDSTYHIYIDDQSGSHYADEQLYIYEGEPSDIREYFHLVDVYTGDDQGGFYDEPYDYTASFTGELYILLVSDNPGYQTFEIRYEVN